jgi:hypothetical protein
VHRRGALFLSRPGSSSILSFILKEYIRDSSLPWWAHLGSNQGPTGYEPVALPAELWAHSYYRVSPKGVNPIRSLTNSECRLRNPEYHSALRNLQSAFEIRFQGNFSASWPGWDVVISLMPLPQSVGFFPGSHQNPVLLLPRYGRIFLQFQTASLRPSLLSG